MTVLRIREMSGLPGGANAELSVDNAETYPLTLSDPFSAAEEERLEWYFEEWLRFPFTEQVRARVAAESILAYGEALFRQVFADPQAYARYRQADLTSQRIEIAGSPEFHRLHWEAIKDPALPQPLALRATLVRKNLQPSLVQATAQPSPTLNLLIVTARPGAQDVSYRTISWPLVEALQQAPTPVRVDILRPGTFKALLDHLEGTTERHGSGYYHLIHFDVHGALLSYADLRSGLQSNGLLY